MLGNIKPMKKIKVGLSRSSPSSAKATKGAKRRKYSLKGGGWSGFKNPLDR